MNLSDVEKLEKAIDYAIPHLGPQARDQLKRFITPESLAIVAGVLVAWVASHFFGIGEIIDIVLVSVGVVAIGLAVFDGIEHLYSFAKLALYAKLESDLKKSGEHFAKAVSILGIQAVLAVLFKGVPKTYKGGRINIGKPPKFATGRMSKPPIHYTKNLPAGAGETGVWGDILVSSRGSMVERRLALIHEKVHRLLTPKIFLLRNFRVSNRASSYSRSPLSVYIEEALAETVAQVGVNGFRSVFEGIAFPVKNGYVSLIKGVEIDHLNLIKSDIFSVC